ncbi:MAG TPA: MBL fold metallo-hydrolase [Hyphomicrobiaceae bacterium]|nr:MBL fold metallo-hydrolase [Hyphomicrobiaceae bacterium]
MRLTVVGCGDAFGSGGRLQSSYLVDADGERFLIDCGATTLIGLSRLGIDPNSIPTIIISHLHGDHFAGLVWWIMHARHVAKRKVALRIAGPPGIEARVLETSEALYPGSTSIPHGYDLSYQELVAGPPAKVCAVEVSVAEVSHPSGAPSYALRCTLGGRTIAFSGDTEWVEALVGIAAGSDLFLTECHGFERAPPYHLAWKTLVDNLPRLSAQRIMITHMSEGMLAHRHVAADLGLLVAEEGMVVEI